ncbi:MAG TPA: DUF2012 domain-containing protein [Candidatus Thermoplasmatota archaeon]|nr:DUF2012 domain-containing protein [Candidatus Thermoplasmatota archaeon]
MRFIALDAETTTMDPSTARIIELHLREVTWPDLHVVSDHGFLLNPGTPIPKEATKVHGYEDPGTPRRLGAIAEFHRMNSSCPLLALVVLLAGCTTGTEQFAGPLAASDPDSTDPTGLATASLSPTSQDGLVGSITGTVSDDELRPIANATVSLDDATQVTTGAEGSFVFLNVPVGDHRLTAQAPEYVPRGVAVNVADGQAVAVAIMLASIRDLSVPYHLTVERTFNIAFSSNLDPIRR